MSIQIELQATIADLVVKGKGILAADESHPTLAKRFKVIGVESTEENPPLPPRFALPLLQRGKPVKFPNGKFRMIGHVESQP